MQTIPIGRYRFFQRLQPLFILNKITSNPVNGCLQVFSTSTSWLIYFEQGKLVYACYGEKMFDLLYQKLQVLSQEIPINSHTYQKLSLIFDAAIGNQAIQNPDYLAICWLVNQKYITSHQAALLVEALTIDVLKSFLSLEEGSYEFTPQSFIDNMPKFCRLDIKQTVEKTLKKPNHQRQTQTQLATKTHSQKEKVQQQIAEFNQKATESQNSDTSRKHQPRKRLSDKRTYTIMCIDDSPAVLNAIRRFLDEEFFYVVTISDPLKALMQTIRVKPDLILLDIGMPNLNGYELCALLRKHSYFQTIPVIMVTARNSLIDRAKAKFFGASGYLTKPFTQADLLKVMFQYLEVNK
jgi:two-component system, chemotaxis family, response regulator PixG